MKVRAYSGNEPYIFVSYAHKNADQVYPLISALQHHGFRVWYDEGIEAGTEWPQYIAEHIIGCSCMVAFISRESEDSLNCRQEIVYALKNKKELLAVYLEEFPMAPGMEMQLGLGQALYYNRHSSDESFLEELVRSSILKNCRTDNLQVEFVPEKKQEQDAAVALYEQGVKYEDGIGVPKDETEAAKHYLEAAKQGHAEAQFRLVQLYGRGRGVPRDAVKATQWCIKAAEQGHAAAQYNLGWKYEKGSGVSEDITKAMEWYTKAAEQGYSAAQYKLGYMYERGCGVLRDAAEAAQWYTKAAEQGHAEAQSELGWMYCNGTGVINDEAKAFEWFSKAAEQGNAAGQRYLGWMYENGRAVPVNKAEALAWYKKAALQFDEYAERALKESWRWR